MAKKNIYNIFLKNIPQQNIVIKKVNINDNLENYPEVLKISQDLFFNELIENLSSETLDLTYKNNIIKLPDNIKKVSYFNYKYRETMYMHFKKNLFLQNYDFIKRLMKYYSKHNLKIEFEQISKYKWKKIVTSL